jgi:hypothetical protein
LVKAGVWFTIFTSQRAFNGVVFSEGVLNSV